jgi:hypothetical protein
MKSIVKIFLSIFVVGFVSAQKPVQKPAVYKQPKGFVFVPATPNNPNQTAFYVMNEPVTVIDFREFITFLYSKARIVDANKCMSSVAKEMDPKSKYILLANGDAIPIYAEYLSEKYSTEKFKVVCSAVSAQAWKQMRGPADNQVAKGNNPYSIKFQEKLNEFRISEKGKITAFTDINGYTRGGFRLVLTVTPKP